MNAGGEVETEDELEHIDAGSLFVAATTAAAFCKVVVNNRCVLLGHTLPNPQTGDIIHAAANKTMKGAVVKMGYYLRNSVGFFFE